MKMEKISLNEERGFSDCITVTFNFVKQEFKPLIKSFAIIVLPLVFVNLFVNSLAVTTSLQMAVDPEQYALGDSWQTTLLSYMTTMLVVFWVMIFGISYIRVYDERHHLTELPAITAREVWQVMIRHLWPVLLWGLIYMLAVFIGAIFFIIPGIYFAVVLLFGGYFIVLQDKSVSQSISSSMSLVHGQWWNFFGYIFVLQLIVSGLAYLFSIPYMVLVFKGVFTQEMPGTYETTFTMMFATLGQAFLYIISMVGIAVRFFSDLEKKEHAGLLSKIDRIGNNLQPERSEESL